MSLITQNPHNADLLSEAFERECMVISPEMTSMHAVTLLMKWYEEQHPATSHSNCDERNGRSL